MARERTRHVKIRNKAADTTRALPVDNATAPSDHKEHKEDLYNFIRALARDQARKDHDRDPG